MAGNPAGTPTTVIAAIALVVSIFSAVVGAIPNIIGFFDPKVEMGAPDRIRLAQYQDENGTRIEAYVQPTLVNIGWNPQVEVIRGMTLQAGPVGGGSPMEFAWSNHGEFSATASSSTSAGCPAEEYAGDTASVVLAPNEPVAPLVLFEPTAKTEDSYFEPGKQYQMTLKVQRTINERSLQEEFTVTVTEDVFRLMNTCKSALIIPVSS